ncbi:MAG: dephospho-CoA kinase [Magnetococcales bacterium]|nr:dephospho-CoA kinase [Magnetococcales bacterium]
MSTTRNQQNEALHPLFLVGLTGSMGCGKSMVGQLFLQAGAWLIDTDQVARQVVAPGSPGLQEIISRFGTHFLQENVAGSPGLDRKKMAAWIFAHSENRIALETILHSRILEAIRVELLQKSQEHRASTNTCAKIAILEVPLLFESGWDRYCDLTINVACASRQWQRLASRNSMSEAVKRQAIQSQLPEEEKNRRAHHIIDNSASMEATASRVAALWLECQRLANNHLRTLWPARECR